MQSLLMGSWKLAALFKGPKLHIPTPFYIHSENKSSLRDDWSWEWVTYDLKYHLGSYRRNVTGFNLSSAFHFNVFRHSFQELYCYLKRNTIAQKKQSYAGYPKINFTFLNVKSVRTNIRIATPAVYIDGGYL